MTAKETYEPPLEGYEEDDAELWSSILCDLTPANEADPSAAEALISDEKLRRGFV